MWQSISFVSSSVSSFIAVLLSLFCQFISSVSLIAVHERKQKLFCNKTHVRETAIQWSGTEWAMNGWRRTKSAYSHLFEFYSVAHFVDKVCRIPKRLQIMVMVSWRRRTTAPCTTLQFNSVERERFSSHKRKRQQKPIALSYC